MRVFACGHMRVCAHVCMCVCVCVCMCVGVGYMCACVCVHTMSYLQGGVERGAGLPEEGCSHTQQVLLTVGHHHPLYHGSLQGSGHTQQSPVKHLPALTLKNMTE